MSCPSRLHLILALAALAAGPPATVHAEEADGDRQRANLGSPDQVDNQLETDRAPKDPLLTLTFLEPYFAFKTGLAENSGFGFGIDYSTVALWASAALPDAEDNAASGMVRVFGAWELVGRQTGNHGALVYKFEHRHRYTAVAPKQLSFNVGYAGITSAPFSDQRFRTTNLYWRQRLGQGRYVFLAGFLDATDFVDVYGLASPWLHFMNLTFSTGSASMALPNDGLLGLAGGLWASDNVYVLASLGDNGSDPTNVFSGFDRFFNVNEYFTTLEVGWTTRKDRAYFDNVHLVVWHSDQKSEAGDPDGWGLNASATWFLQDKWMPFVRAGYAEDGGSLLEGTVSTGVGYQGTPGRDVLGLGLNWGKANSTTWGDGLRDQVTLEAFWRWQLGEQLAVTPDLQLLINPANNPDEDQIWMLGLRARLAL